MEEGETSHRSFQKGWALHHEDMKKLIDQIEKGVDIHNSSFRIHDYMSFYRTVYELRAKENNFNILYDHYKNVYVEYINSKVLSSLRAEKNEQLLRELLKKWSNHKTITDCLSRLFRSLETFDMRKLMEHSLQQIGFLYFYDVVHDEDLKKQVMDAILTMIDEDRAGKQIDKKLVNDILALYWEIEDKNGKKDEKYFVENLIKANETSKWIVNPSLNNSTLKDLKLNAALSKKMIKLMSCDGNVFEVEYEAAIMLKTIEDVIETYPNIGDDDYISLSMPMLNNKILGKIIEYCKKHKEKHISDDDDDRYSMEDWDANFIDLDRDTLFNIVLSSMYLNIKSLRDLACDKIANMIKDMNTMKIRKFFKMDDV